MKKTFNSRKKLFSAFSFLLLGLFTGCAGSPIIKPIPLDANPPILAKPIFLSIDEGRSRGYLINSNNTVNYSDASLQALDLTDPAHPKLLRAVSMKNFSGQAYLDAPNQKLYVTNRLNFDKTDKNDQIFKVELNEAVPDFLKIEDFEADSNPFGIISNGTDLFVVNQKSVNRYSLSDLTKRTRVDFNLKTTAGTVLNTLETREIALSPSGKFLFVSNRNGRMILLSEDQIPVPDPTLSLTLGGSEAVDYDLANTFSTRGIATDHQYVYVVEGSPPSLKIFSDKDLPTIKGDPVEILASTLQVGEIPLSAEPNEVVIDSAKNRAYITLFNDHEVAIVDTQLMKEIARISVKDNLPAGMASGENPLAISIGHFFGKSYIYILNYTTNNLSILDGDNLQWVGSYP